MDAELVYWKDRVLDIYVDEKIDFGALSIPKGVRLVETRELREQYRKALRVQAPSVRHQAAYLLSQIDPYGEESLAAINRPFTEDEERQSVEPAIKEFEARAKDPPEVRALYAATEKQIHEFVFYWRYRMMMIALVVAVAGAIVLLVGTLLFARAKKRRTAVIT